MFGDPRSGRSGCTSSTASIFGVEGAAELLDAPVSTGWLCLLQQEAAARLVPFMTCLQDRLAQ